MPLNTGAALAVSLIPAAVIVLYNIMENGVPGGESIKNFINSDNIISGSASSVFIKNVSIIENSTSENVIDSVSDKIRIKLLPFSTSSTEGTTGTVINAAFTEAVTNPPATPTSTTTAATTTRASTTTPKTTTTVGTTIGTTTTGTTTTTTSTSTTTTTPTPVILSKLSVCCSNVRVSGNRLVGHCDADSVKESSELGLTDVWSVPARIMSTGEETMFTLETTTPACKDGKLLGQLPLSTEAISEDHFLADGMLKYKNEYYRPNEYCIRGRNTQNEDLVDVQVCNINCSNPETPCIHKCCEYDEIYSMGMKGQRGGCLRMDPNKNESVWSPALYDEYEERLTSVELTLRGVRPHVIQSNPTSFRHLCPRNATTVFPYGQQVADFLGTVLRYPFSSLKFMMRKDGWLMNPNENQKNVAISRTLRTTKYCIDGVMNYGENEPFMNLEEQTVLFLCLGAAEELSTSSRAPRAESLIASSTNNQAYSTSTTTTSTSTTTPPTTVSTTPSTTTTTTTTQKPTTTQAATTTTTTKKPTTTQAATSTTTEKPTTTPAATTTSTTTTTTKPTTASTTSTTTTTTTSAPTTIQTTTEPPTTTLLTTTSTEPPLPPPVLPICCPLNPDADENDENENEISHHCKSPVTGLGEDDSNGIMNATWIASPNFMYTHKVTKFMMEVKPLKCQKWTKTFVHNLGKLLSASEPVLMPDGMLKMGNDYYREGEFCVNGVFPNIVEVHVCKTNCSDPQTPCIQKCCAPNEVYSLGVGGKKRGCIPLAEEDAQFNPPLYKDMGTKLEGEELEKMSPHLVQKYPPKFQYSCYKNVTLVFPFSSDVIQFMSPLAQINLEFKLRQDGKVIYKHPSIRNASGELIESAFSTYNFCVDGIRNFGEPQGPYKNAEDQTILFVCAVNPPGHGEIK